MYSKKKLINKHNKKNKKRLSRKKNILSGKKPLFRLYANKFVKYC